MTIDLTTFTEVDSGSYLSVAADVITISALPASGANYVYKDYGASHFDKVDILFKLEMDSSVSTLDRYAGMGLTVSVLGDRSGWGSSDVFVASYYYNTNNAGIYLVRGTDFANINTVTGLSKGVFYYCRLLRLAGSDTFTLYIYSDAARTSLVATLILAGFGTGTKYRYLYAVTNNSGNANWAGVFGDYIVQEAGGGFFAFFFHNWKRVNGILRPPEYGKVLKPAWMQI